MSADIHNLAGAYALNALDDVERAQFERHLTACPACMGEVDGFAATTARLGAVVAEPPPPALRDRVLAEVDVTRQRSPLGGWGPTARSRRTLRRLVAPAAAAVAAVVITLTVVGALPRADDRAFDQVAAILAAADAETVPLETSGGFTARVVSSADAGQAVLALDGLDEPEDGVYVLWAFRDGTPINEQTLTGQRDGGATAILVGDLADVSQVAMTVEPHGEVTAPTGPIVARADLP